MNRGCNFGWSMPLVSLVVSLGLACLISFDVASFKSFPSISRQVGEGAQQCAKSHDGLKTEVKDIQLHSTKRQESDVPKILWGRKFLRFWPVSLPESIEHLIVHFRLLKEFWGHPKFSHSKQSQHGDETTAAVKCWSPDWGRRKDAPTRPTSPEPTGVTCKQLESTWSPLGVHLISRRLDVPRNGWSMNHHSY